MAVFLENRCTFSKVSGVSGNSNDENPNNNTSIQCGLRFGSLFELIHHIEDNHIVDADCEPQGPYQAMTPTNQPQMYSQQQQQQQQPQPQNQSWQQPQTWYNQKGGSTGAPHPNIQYSYSYGPMQPGQQMVPMPVSLPISCVLRMFADTSNKQMKQQPQLQQQHYIYPQQTQPTLQPQQSPQQPLSQPPSAPSTPQLYQPAPSMTPQHYQPQPQGSVQVATSIPAAMPVPVATPTLVPPQQPPIQQFQAPPPLLKCPKCKRCYKTPQGLKNHVESRHKEGAEGAPAES